MRNKNICKFIAPASPDALDIDCFIFESDQETMRKPTTLRHHRVILVKNGKGAFIFDGKEMPFSSGSLVFGFINETVSVRCDAPCEYIYISFSGQRAEALFRRFGIHKTNRCFSGFDGLLPLVHESLSRASEANIDLAAESILLYIFSRLTGISPERGNLITSIIEISEEHFSDPELSISEIAKELAYNAKYLSHLFKEKMGISYTEYLRTLRIKYAVSLFDRGLDSVKNVAYLSGFSDSLYFSSVFKKTIGISPKEYKQLNTNKKNE
ncbi:MAG: helix-turn-helix transcriptional regulator [Clostridia bacterium]|nr:helix-turn-helix transcriptional regulator [Clostridia bacterium]